MIEQMTVRLFLLFINVNFVLLQLNINRINFYQHLKFIARYFWIFY